MRPPPDDLLPLIEKPSIKQGFERPPDTFNVGFVVGDVGLFQVHPEANSFGEFLPNIGVGEDGIDAPSGEGFQAIVENRFFAVDPQGLLHFDFDR